MRWVLLAILLASCDQAPAARPRNDRVAPPDELREPPEQDVPEEAIAPPPERGGEHRLFEVVSQMVPRGAPEIANGTRVAVLDWGSADTLEGYASVIDLRSGVVRATRAADAFDEPLLSPDERSVRFFRIPDEGAPIASLWDLMRDTTYELEGSGAAGAFSSDGRSYAYIARDAELRVFRFGARDRRIGDASGDLVYFNPRGDRVLVSGERARLFDVRRGRLVVEMAAAAEGAPFDPRGRFVIGLDGAIQIRDARTGAIVREVPLRPNARSIVWSPRGEIFCIDQTIVDPSTGETRAAGAPCEGELRADGRIVPLEAPRNAIELAGEDVVRRVRERRVPIAACDVPVIEWIRPGALEISWLAAGARWIMAGAERRQATTPIFPLGELRIELDPEARSIDIQRGNSPTIALADVPPDVELVCEDMTHALACDAVSLTASLDGGCVVLSSAGRAFVFNAATGARLAALEHVPPGAEYAVSAERIAAIADGHSVLFDVSGHPVHDLPGASGGGLSPDGRELALFSDRRIEIFAAADGARLRRMRAPSAISRIAWREPGAIHAIVTRPWELVRLSPANGAILSRTSLAGERGRDPLGARSVRCRDGSVYLFTADDREERGPLGRCPSTEAFGVTSDGPFLTWTDGMHARLYRIADGEVLEIVPLDEGHAVAFTETGWFEALDVPLDALRLRTGSIARGTIHLAAGSPNHRPGLIAAFLSGADLGDAPELPRPAE